MSIVRFFWSSIAGAISSKVPVDYNPHKILTRSCLEGVMKKMALVLCPLILCTCSLDLYSFEGHSFYVDTENGDMSNDGSFDHPWKSLQSVCDDKVETRAYKGSYSSGTGNASDEERGGSGSRLVIG